MKAVVVVLAAVVVIAVVNATIIGFNKRTFWAFNGMTFLEELQKKYKLYGKAYSCKKS